MEDFAGRMKYNQWYSLYVLTESVSCIHLVVDECLKVRSGVLHVNESVHF